MEAFGLGAVAAGAAAAVPTPLDAAGGAGPVGLERFRLREYQRSSDFALNPCVCGAGLLLLQRARARADCGEPLGGGRYEPNDSRTLETVRWFNQKTVCSVRARAPVVCIGVVLL